VTASLAAQIGIGGPVTLLSLLIRVLELFVAFLQAYIFREAASLPEVHRVCKDGAFKELRLLCLRPFDRLLHVVGVDVNPSPGGRLRFASLGAQRMVCPVEPLDEPARVCAREAGVLLVIQELARELARGGEHRIASRFAVEAQQRRIDQNIEAFDRCRGDLERSRCVKAACEDRQTGLRVALIERQAR